MGHSIFLKFYFMTHMIYVIVFVLRNHYVAGENNRMSNHRSLTFVKFDFMTHMSHSDYNVIHFNYVTNIHKSYYLCEYLPSYRTIPYP